MIRLQNISLSFSQPVLKNINLTIERGETLGIVGKSGAGKSTLLSIIAGKITPNEGEVFYENQILPYPNELLIPGYSFVQIVEQKFNLDLFHTVYENIHLKAVQLPFDKRDNWVRKIMGILGLKKLEKHKAVELSGGEQQRLAIARALASKPTILLMDEPFAHLDELLKSKLQNYLAKLKEEINCTMILVSHDGVDLLSLTDHIVHLKNGKLSKKNTPKNLYFSPKNREQAELFGYWNSLEIDNSCIHFRPSEYQIVTKDGVSIESVKTNFKGVYYENQCFSKYGEFVLNSLTPIQKGTQIVIQKQN